MGNQSNEKRVVEPEVVEKKPLQVYYAKFLNFSFDYPAMDENGKVKYKTNPNTGMKIMDLNGNPEAIEISENFKVFEPRFSKGYLSRATHDPNDTDPQMIVRGKALEALAANRSIKVYTEDDYEKATNPKAYTERKAREALEAENKELKKEASKAKELEAKLAYLEGRDKA